MVAWLLGQLVGPRGLGPALTPAEVIGRLNLEGNPFIQSRLMRPPLKIDKTASGVSEKTLVQQLAGLVSTKGADLMLNSSPEEIQGHQRLRRTVNPKMWQWKELRACLACVRWRLEHLRNHDCRIFFSMPSQYDERTNIEPTPEEDLMPNQLALASA